MLLAVLASVAGPGSRTPARAADGVFEADDPPETRYRLAPFLTFGAEVEVESTVRREFRLDGRRPEATALLAPELSLALSWDPSPAVQAFLNVAAAHRFVVEAPPGGPDDDSDLEVKEAYLWLRHPAGLSLQVGRQQFEDEREWLYDEELDAVRLWYRRGAVEAELSVSRDGLVRKDLLSTAQEPRVVNYIARAGIRLGEDLEVEGYFIVRDDQATDRRRPLFLGLRSRGEPIEDLDYWLELAWVTGRDGATQLNGWGLEAGVTYELQWGPVPALTLGVALGSGDRDPEDGVDRSFRQTGLQDNEGDFGGAASFKYYGEVFDPELSNLVVLTAGLGLRPREGLSLDVVYHYYLQHRPAATLRDSSLDAEPSGRSRRLGSEIDVVGGLEGLWDRLDAKLAVGWFFPGAAFPGTSGTAWFVGAEVQFRF